MVHPYENRSCVVWDSGHVPSTRTRPAPSRGTTPRYSIDLATCVPPYPTSVPDTAWGIAHVATSVPDTA
eukprot:2537400-Rhodomonas_salina.2